MRESMHMKLCFGRRGKAACNLHRLIMHAVKERMRNCRSRRANSCRYRYRHCFLSRRKLLGYR